MGEAAGGVTREDIRLAYELILQRHPESEQAYDAHRHFPNRMALGKALLRSEEFRRRQSMPAMPATPPAFVGFRPADVALVRRFRPYDGPGEAGFTTNFLGVRTRVAFVTTLGPFDGVVEPAPVPAGSLIGGATEWLGTLKSVLGATGCWRMLELGAGFGPWMTATAAAARQCGITDIRLYGVEGDAGHAAFMHQHLCDNGLDPADHVLLHGVVGATDGTARWAEVADPARVYGGRPLPDSGVDYHGALQPRQATVPMFGITDLLAREPRWNLVHMDIQGGEAEVCRAGMAALTERVGWAVVGTHGRLMDGEVMAAFHAAGWWLEHETPSIMAWREKARSLESMTTADGAQVWRNPRLAAPIG